MLFMVPTNKSQAALGLTGCDPQKTIDFTLVAIFRLETLSPAVAIDVLGNRLIAQRRLE
jgi:hypothetical protein